jgi:hypothetical protein
MAIAEDLDRATDSQWGWVAEHTGTYLASGGEYVVVASKGGAEEDPAWFMNPRGGPRRRRAGRHSPVHRTRTRRVLGRARAPLARMVNTARSRSSCSPRLMDPDSPLERP